MPKIETLFGMKEILTPKTRVVWFHVLLLFWLVRTIVIKIGVREKRQSFFQGRLESYLGDGILALVSGGGIAG